MIKFITGLLVLFSLAILPVDDMWAAEGSPVLDPFPELKATDEGLCDPTYSFITNIPLRAQETGSWCWAAVQQMVMWDHGHYIEQCSIATAVLKDAGAVSPAENCCRSDRKYLPECATTAWPNFSLMGFHVTQIDVTNRNDPLKSGEVDGWKVLKAQICHGLPFLITLQSPTNSHQYIVNGYYDGVALVIDKLFGPPTILDLRVVYAIDPLGVP